jgi:hypothetical protein
MKKLIKNNKKLLNAKLIEEYLMDKDIFSVDKQMKILKKELGMSLSL